jgi:predicted secreted protein
MIHKAMMVAGMAVLMATAPGSAQDKKEDAPTEKKICRSEKITGSRTRVQRICMTKAEWDELAAGTRKDVDKMQGNSWGRPCGLKDPTWGGGC